MEEERGEEEVKMKKRWRENWSEDMVKERSWGDKKRKRRRET
jgi:hypothetical protein